ncbi:hypothetical protein [Pseudonocardia phyllosphaerae]|uniref:hypothetical protein n=1 Tax=Pseudonocardia phyllosphaerae TaxID=3390502 RepID=UPI00397AC9F3
MWFDEWVCLAGRLGAEGLARCPAGTGCGEWAGWAACTVLGGVAGGLAGHVTVRWMLRPPSPRRGRVMRTWPGPLLGRGRARDLGHFEEYGPPTRSRRRRWWWRRRE